MNAPMCKNASQSHMFAVTNGEALHVSETDADLGGLFATIRNICGFRQANDNRLAIWLL